MRSSRRRLLLTRCSRRFMVGSCGGGPPRESRDSVEFFAQHVEIVARSPTVAVWRHWERICELALDRVPLVVPGDAVLPDQLEPHLVQVVLVILAWIPLLGAGEICPGTRIGRQAGEGLLDLEALLVGERREALFEPSRRAAAG